MQPAWIANIYKRRQLSSAADEARRYFPEAPVDEKLLLLNSGKQTLERSLVLQPWQIVCTPLLQQARRLREPFLRGDLLFLILEARFQRKNYAQHFA